MVITRRRGRWPGPVMEDVVVIGGGPAGQATAIAARSRGLSCLVLEHRAPPIDKACGEGLMPDGLRALRRLGIEAGPDAGACFRGIRFTDGDVSVEAAFPDGVGVGIRRPRLHELLVEHAERLGARIRWRARVALIDGHTVRADGDEIRGRWLVGADGLHSGVRRWAGLHHASRDATRYALRRHYRLPPWSDCVEVHWGARGQLYVTPVGPDEICVVLLTRRPGYRFEAALADFPWLASRLRRAPAPIRRSCRPARLPGTSPAPDTSTCSTGATRASERS